MPQRKQAREMEPSPDAASFVVESSPSTSPARTGIGIVEMTESYSLPLTRN